MPTFVRLHTRDDLAKSTQVREGWPPLSQASGTPIGRRFTTRKIRSSLNPGRIHDVIYPVDEVDILPTGLWSNMLIEIGFVEAIFRYPVKSMAGESIEVANLGWYGLEGDRRLAFRRIDDRSGMPWLTASKLPDLLPFTPLPRQDVAQEDIPTHVRTPDGIEMSVFGDDLAKEVGLRHGAPVQMMQLRHGIFDEATISVIASDTVREIGRLAGHSLDVRRFRPNIVVRLLHSAPFQEDGWLGRVLSFGAGDDAPAINVTMRDERCSMVNIDPDSGSLTPQVMKTVVRANQNNAGIYGAVTRIGRLAVGQAMFIRGAIYKKEGGN